MNDTDTSWTQSVTAVVINDGKVLLARHTYGNGSGLLIVPGGYINIGEMPQDAVKREYLEKTGVIIEPKNIIAIRCNSKDWYITFAAEYISGDAHSDNDENSEVIWLSIDEAMHRDDVPDLTKKLISAALSNIIAVLKKLHI